MKYDGSRPSVLSALRASLNAAISIVLLSYLLGCDSQEQQDQFAREASAPPSGITETTPDGDVVAEDADDWRTSPAFRGVLNVEPAFPNPVGGGDVYVHVRITQFDRLPNGLALRAYRGDTFPILGVPVTQVDPGIHVLRFNPGELVTTGLHRVFLFDHPGGELISYGDIRIE